MFGKKAKRVDELEVLVRELLEVKQRRESLIGEMRQILDCAENEDIRVKARALWLNHETLLNLVKGAAATMEKADKWFSEQEVEKAPKRKKK